MNVHEYQAKKILAENGIKVPPGGVAYTPAEAKKIAQKISSRGPWMLKAQIQAGARAMGHFIEHTAGQKSGIRKVTRIANISYETSLMLNNTLVTDQTGPKGQLVNRVYVESYMPVKRFFYAGMIIDSAIPAITLLISEVINQDILSMFDMRMDKILHINLKYGSTIKDEQILRILDFLSLEKTYLPSFRDFFMTLHQTFIRLDAQMIEINPVGIMKDKSLIALDAKINFDDNALFRHPEITRMHIDYEQDQRTAKAQEYSLDYHEFDGNIGCIVNGEGSALEAMDIIRSKGADIACTLDIKGSVDKDRIAAGIRIIMTNPRVEGILINVLGGFLRCNLIADGIVSVAQEVGLTVPLIVRFEGTNKAEALSILEQSDLQVLFADDTSQAVDKLIKQMEVND